MIVTIQGDPEAIDDTVLYSGSADENFGTSGMNLFGGTDTYRHIIKVDLSAYAGMTPTIAKFSLNTSFVSGALTDVHWYRVLRSWLEDEATWNSYITGFPWDIAGCDGTGTGSDRESSPQNASPFTIDTVGIRYDIDCLPASVALDMGGYFSIIMMNGAESSTAGTWSADGGWGDSVSPYFYMEYTEAVLVIPGTSKDISRKDKKLLSTHDDITYVAPEATDADTRYEVASEKAEEESNVNHYLAQYKKIVDTSDQIAEILDKRCNNYIFKFDPTKMPALAQAIRKVFGKDTTEITYDMYKQVLEEQIALSEKIGDEIFAQ